MQENVCNLPSQSSLTWDIRYQEKDLSFGELLTQESFQEDSMSDQKKRTLHTYEIEAAKGIAQIRDPLWRRVCIDALSLLGPIAFKNLWKIKLSHISTEERKAYLSCPTLDIVETIENYDFVIIEALKKFYPSLLSLETEVTEAYNHNEKSTRTKINSHQHIS